MEAAHTSETSICKDRNRGAGGSRYFLVAIFTIIICLSGYPISAVAPLKELLRAVHKPGQNTGLSPEQTAAAKAAFEAFITTTISNGIAVSVFLALITGTVLDLIGPKITGFFGQVTLIGGFGMMFIGTSEKAISAGAILMGVSYIPIFASKVSIASLFPSSMALVLAILGAAPDIALFIPTALKLIADQSGISHVVVIKGYMVLLAILALAELVFVPFRAYGSTQTENPATAEESSPLTPEVGDIEKSTPKRELGLFHTVILQIGTPQFILFSLFTGFNMFRKLYYCQLAPTMFELVGEITHSPPESVALLKTVYNLSLPFAFVPALIMGSLTNMKGIIFGLLLQNSFGVALFLCASISSISLQYCGIVCYNLMSSYIFGSVFAYLAAYYGFRTMGVLQGFQFFVAAIFAKACNYYVVYGLPKLPSIFYSNTIMMAVGAAMFMFPIFIMYRPPRRPINQLDFCTSMEGSSFSDAEVQRTVSVLGAEPFMHRKSYVILNQHRKKLY